jgi:phosphoribosylaminoimidazolecarboxamide formyltransferase/IMP cyclohydrolase
VPNKSPLKIRRALFTVSDKQGCVELAQALVATGTELVATGRTAQVLMDAGLKITPIEKVSGSPEAFQGRMKTLSFPVCSGILYRRGDAQDEADLKKLGIVPIDCVVVNFYPFEKAAATSGISRAELIEEVDIGGPTLVRAAAKNAPDVLVLTDPLQYDRVIADLKKSGGVSPELSLSCASEAWDRVLAYDEAIAGELGLTGEPESPGAGTFKLRYGENPHQEGMLEFDPDGPIAWGAKLTSTELSYNNILDLSSAYQLASDLCEIDPGATGVVIVKHNNPCGVALVPRSLPHAQKTALLKAWEGDPVSAFGGVLVFTHALEQETAAWLAEKFIELVGAPELDVAPSASGGPLATLLAKRKNLRAVPIRRFGEAPRKSRVAVPGGVLTQSTDLGLGETLKSVTRKAWPTQKDRLGKFGIAVCRALKSNAIAIVRELPPQGESAHAGSGGFQLVGAGQGQPNRVEALKHLAVPRAENVLNHGGGRIEDTVMVSDAFFPFRDTVDAAFDAGITAIIQPGGSIKDAESIAACDEHGMMMAFTGTRHFKH